MHGAGRPWDGHEWEEYVMQLLRLHYPPGELVEVPDRDRGDAGLEAFAADGCAYQCYAPEEPLSVDDRYGKQRDKIAADLNKFKDAGRISPVLGVVEIRRWILITPVLDSRRLVEYCNRKAAEIRDSGLAYVSEDFEVRALTDDAFPLQRSQLIQAGLNELALGTSAPSLDTRLRFIDENGPQTANLDRKLAKVPALAEVERRETYAREMVDAYLEGSDARQRLRDDYPDLARPVDRVIADFRRSLVLRYSIVSDSADQTLMAVVSELQAQVKSCLPGLRHADNETIAYAAIAEWLMDCHLELA
jgi:hypothetical protein